MSIVRCNTDGVRLVVTNEFKVAEQVSQTVLLVGREAHSEAFHRWDAKIKVEVGQNQQKSAKSETTQRETERE